MPQHSIECYSKYWKFFPCNISINVLLKYESYPCICWFSQSTTLKQWTFNREEIKAKSKQTRSNKHDTSNKTYKLKRKQCSIYWDVKSDTHWHIYTCTLHMACLHLSLFHSFTCSLSLSIYYYWKSEAVRAGEIRFECQFGIALPNPICFN